MDDRRWRWWLMLVRRVCLLVLTETERELGMESSVLTKQEREHRKRDTKLTPVEETNWNRLPDGTSNRTFCETDMSGW